MAHGVFAVIHKLKRQPAFFFQRVDKAIHRAIAVAFDGFRFTIHHDLGAERLIAMIRRGVMFHKFIFTIAFEIFSFKGTPQVLRIKLHALAIGNGLHGF